MQALFLDILQHDIRNNSYNNGQLISVDQTLHLDRSKKMKNIQLLSEISLVNSKISPIRVGPRM